MLALIPAPYRIMALVAILAISNAVTAYRFYHTGYAIAEARQAAALVKAQAATAKAAEAALRAESERLAVQATADKLAQELEDEARKDPDAVRRVPTSDSLRRLERRWGGAN